MIIFNSSLSDCLFKFHICFLFLVIYFVSWNTIVILNVAITHAFEIKLPYMTFIFLVSNVKCIYIFFLSKKYTVKVISSVCLTSKLFREEAMVFLSSLYPVSFLNFLLNEIIFNLYFSYLRKAWKNFPQSLFKLIITTYWISIWTYDNLLKHLW